MAGYTERNMRSGVWKGDLNSSPLRCMHGSIVAAWIISYVSPALSALQLTFSADKIAGWKLSHPLAHDSLP